MDAEVADAEDTRARFRRRTSRRSIRAGVAAEEPHLDDRRSSAALHWTDPASVSDPHAPDDGLCRPVRAARRQPRRAATPRPWRRTATGGASTTEDGPVEARRRRGRARRLGRRGHAARSATACRSAVKRGYHMHYRPAGNAVLNHPILDAERGYFLAPMAQRHPPHHRRRVRRPRRAEDPGPARPRRARARRRSSRSASGVDPEPWMGMRPCTPDMMPIIGPAPEPQGALVRLRPRPSRPDARAGHRPADRRDDDRRANAYRSDALPGGPVLASHRPAALFGPDV